MTPQTLLQHNDTGTLWSEPLSATNGFDLSAAYRSALTQRTRCDAHQRLHDAARNARPGRAKYDAAWAAHSRQRRAEQPWCSMADATCRGVLSVDHPSDAVLCMSHHDRMESQRRGAASKHGG